MKALVNQVEQPFARSLVACDTPVDGNYTGSELCGDRLTVLQEGFGISQVGQAQESFAMLCSLSVVAVLAGAFGRKLVVCLGLIGTACSVVLFVFASESPEAGRRLFAYGQGLQGLYPVDYLQGMIVLDMSTQLGGDGQMTWQLAQYRETVGNFVWTTCLGNTVQVMELTSYGTVWSVILGVNVCITILALLKMPETKHTIAQINHDEPAGKKSSKAKKDKAGGKDKADGDDVADKADKLGPAGKVMAEILSYRGLLTDPRARRYLTVRCVEFMSHSVFVFGILPVQLMAYHGWTQTQFVVFVSVLTPLNIMCMPLYGKLQDMVGFERAYRYAIFYLSGCGLIMTLGVPIAGVGGWIAASILVLCGFMKGFDAMRGFVDSRFCEPEQVSRFMNAQWIAGYVMGSFVGPIYASMLNVKGETYWERALPNMIMAALGIVNTTLALTVLWSMTNGTEGIGVTLRSLDTIVASGRRTFLVLRAKRPLLGKVHPDGPQ
ncbi:unnamed protein product, partial [Polarella glacialis]